MPLLQPIQLLGYILNSRADFISRLHYSPVPISFAPLAALKMGAGVEDALSLLLFFLISNRRARFVQGTPCLLCSLPTFCLLTQPALRAKISKTRVRICTLTLPCKKHPLNYPSDYFSDVIIDANRAFFYLFWTICLPCVYTNIG